MSLSVRKYICMRTVQLEFVLLEDQGQIILTLLVSRMVQFIRGHK